MNHLGNRVAETRDLHLAHADEPDLVLSEQHPVSPFPRARG